MGNLPLWAVLGLLAVVGLIAGFLVNRALFALVAPSAGPRPWRTILPVLGCAAAVPALYWWEVVGQAVPPAAFACHVVLGLLMLAASLVDIDQRVIPDAITLPGTLLGLLAAAVYPAVLPLLLTSPIPWPPLLDGPWGLTIALGCWWLWCVGLMPRTWYARHGWRRAVALSIARVLRERSSLWLAVLGLAGSGAIAGLWRHGGGHWQGLLTSLVGMAGAGGLVWMVRIVGTAVLRREAMGFGDVTLMAMIGTLVGWQAGVIIFFIAPFLALAIGVVILIVHRESEICYGPFLCLATVLVVLRWPDFWDWAKPVFGHGLLIPAVLVFCMALLAVLLGMLQWVKSLFR